MIYFHNDLGFLAKPLTSSVLLSISGLLDILIYWSPNPCTDLITSLSLSPIFPQWKVKVSLPPQKFYFPYFLLSTSGLLDIPICSVNDQGFFANPRYSLQFPPDNYNQKKLSKSWDHRLPVNAINVNSQLHPINTITGLAYFTGLRNYPWREKAIPKVGLGKVLERVLEIGTRVYISATGLITM